MTGYVTRAQLTAMVNACPADTLAGKRDRLLLVVLRALEGRSGELVALQHQDAMSLNIPAGEYSEHDPEELLTTWKAALPWHRAELYNYPLFSAITKQDQLRSPGESLTPASVTRIVKRAAARAGLDNPEQYSARSLRGPARRKVDK